MPEGATVCGRCGAYEKHITTGCMSWGCLMLIGMAIGYVATFAIAAQIFVSGWTVTSVIVGIAGCVATPAIANALARRILPKRTVWLHDR